MPDFHEELERRTEQFKHFLELMNQRRSEITKGNCFIIFQERHGRDERATPQLTASKALVHQASQTVVGWDSPLDDDILIDLPDEGWRGDDSSCRFVQFSFNPQYFDMDIPNTTLFWAEAESILRGRSGFFYVKDRRQFEHPAEKVDCFNPLRKVFVKSDGRTAAEDMAYVFFNVWKFPVDWRFFVTAAAFHESTNWEKGYPIE